MKHWRSALTFGLAVGLVALLIALAVGRHHQNACEDRGGHIGPCKPGRRPQAGI